MYKLFIDSKVMNKRYDVTDIVSDIGVSFKRTETASKIDFTIHKDNIVVYHEGDCVEFYDDDIPVFKGYTFTKTANEKKEIKTVSYDQLRYLKAKQSYSFKEVSLTGIIQTIANQFKLNIGEIVDVGYKTPYYYHEDESLLDIITYHVTQAKLLTDTELVFFDDFGKLTLKKADDMTSKYVIGNESFATGYSYKTDIDSDTYNIIKLIRPNEESGGGDVYQQEDDDKMKRWGVLQYYEVVDENLNDVQIKEYLNLLFNYHNKVFRSLTIDAIGIPGLRGGSTVYVNIPDIGDISLTKSLLVDSVTHKYKNPDHTMTLEMEVR